MSDLSACRNVNQALVVTQLLCESISQELAHQDVIRQLKLEHAKEITKLRQEFELQAKELQQKYEKKMKMLRDDLELRRKQVGGGASSMSSCELKSV